MQCDLAPQFQGTKEGIEAKSILGKCVHCGFCTATCPTYQLLGDELDGPRGRIYLIKQVLEGQAPTRRTQLHLDRCLTCRNCETTCPSGVQYGNLVDIGRKVVDRQVKRPASESVKRWVLKEGLSSPLFAPAMAVGRTFRGLLPAAIKAKIPPVRHSGTLPTLVHRRKFLMLAGCVQPSMMPNINRATARVLDAANIQVVIAQAAGCCGAVKYHLDDHDGAKAQMRANIDAWWPMVERNEIEAIVMNASGCGVTVREYGRILQSDAAYAEKARVIGELTKDLGSFLPELVPLLKGRVNAPSGVVAYHEPCTLQHGQRRAGEVEAGLHGLGFRIRVAVCEPHLCCGSAGTYSVLQPEIAYALRDRKLEHLEQLRPVAIASANIGCITHLQSGSELEVRHWIELVDAAMA